MSPDTTQIALPNISYRLCGAISMIIKSFHDDIYQMSDEDRINKINLIAYYLQAWSYSQMDHPLFKDDFIATNKGPAIKSFDDVEYDGLLTYFSKYDLMTWCFSDYEIDFMEKIINNYAMMTLEAVYSAATQEESPYADHFASRIQGADWSHTQKRNDAISEYLIYNTPEVIDKDIIKARYLHKIK